MTDTTPAELAEVIAAADAAAPLLRDSTPQQRAAWLEALAVALEQHSDELVPLAHEETHLSIERLPGEIARSAFQLRSFAEVVLDGAYLEVSIDHPVPDAMPPRPDLRRMLRPLGPVAVYAALNLPFALAVLGSDTASALAVGCPVIVKAHPGYPRTSRRTAEIGRAALIAAGAPAGTLGLVEGFDAGAQLVTHPSIKAAAFTGSPVGGRALFDLASGRPDPIPFYAEMGSINPVILTAGALAERSDQIADGLVASFTIAVGQYCTKPGLVFVPEGSDLANRVSERISGMAPATLLGTKIADGLEAGWSHVQTVPGIDIVQPVRLEATEAAPGLITTTARNVAENPVLAEELFGPVTIIASYDSYDEVGAALASVDGSLAATIHKAGDEDVSALVETAERFAGRITFDDWPTGIAVSWSTQHGGPWPASTSLFTSVGSTATRRFLRPVTYQNAPLAAQPPAVRDDNPLGIPRRIDGQLQLS